MKRKMLIPLLVLALIASACQPAGPEPAEEPEEEIATPVVASPVNRGTLQQDIRITGVSKANKETAVHPLTAGKISQLHIQRGDVVTPGQLLAVLDDSDIRLSIQMEQVNLEVGRNQLATAQSGLRQAEEAALEQLSQLGESNEQIEESINQARQAVQSAQLNIESAELRIQQASKALEDLAVHAITGGVVSDVAVNVGEMASPQAPLATIISDHPLIVDINVSVEMLREFTPGEEIEVVFPSVGESRTGTIDLISPTAAQNGLYTVEINLDNEDRQFRAGTAAEVAIPRILADQALLVPTDAVIERSGDTYVFVIREGRANQVHVELLHTLSDTTAVEGEIEEGEQVVTRGQLTLSDGQLVAVEEEVN